MTTNKDTVFRYLDGFEKSDRGQILDCLTDDIRWTVFGAYYLEGKEAYDANIESPGFAGGPRIDVIRMVEEDGVVMAELAIEATRDTGEVLRMVAGEVFVFRDGLICERKAYLIQLQENEYR